MKLFRSLELKFSVSELLAFVLVKLTDSIQAKCQYQLLVEKIKKYIFQNTSRLVQYHCIVLGCWIQLVPSF